MPWGSICWATQHGMVLSRAKNVAVGFRVSPVCWEFLNLEPLIFKQEILPFSAKLWAFENAFHIHQGIHERLKTSQTDVDEDGRMDLYPS